MMDPTRRQPLPGPAAAPGKYLKILRASILRLC